MMRSIDNKKKIDAAIRQTARDALLAKQAAWNSGMYHNLLEIQCHQLDIALPTARKDDDEQWVSTIHHENEIQCQSIEHVGENADTEGLDVFDPNQRWDSPDAVTSSWFQLYGSMLGEVTESAIKHSSTVSTMVQTHSARRHRIEPIAQPDLSCIASLDTAAGTQNESSGDQSQSQLKYSPSAPSLRNLGYAMRVACLQQQVQAWLQYQQVMASAAYSDFTGSTRKGGSSGECRHVQLVVLGAGLDVAGLVWARLTASTAAASSSMSYDPFSRLALHVVEFDLPEICEMKKKQLAEYPDAWTALPYDATCYPSLVWHGIPQYPPLGTMKATGVQGDMRDGGSRMEYDTEARAGAGSSTWTLLSADLRNVDQLNAAWDAYQQVVFADTAGRIQQVISRSNNVRDSKDENDKLGANNCPDCWASIPTLVLSEVVLAYLGQSAIDSLLAWVADTMLRQPQLSSNYVRIRTDSCFLAWEPLGHTRTDSTDDSFPSRSDTVVESYHRHYFLQFESKLQAAHAQSVAKRSEMDAIQFHPLGTCESHVRERLYACGMHAPSIQVVTAGLAAAKLLRRPHGTRDKAHNNAGVSSSFDEHAALALHLQSYAMICSFAAMNPPDRLLFRTMCRWTCGRGLTNFIPRPIPIFSGSQIMSTPSDTAVGLPYDKASKRQGAARHAQISARKKMYWMTVLERCDEESVRTMIHQFYQPFFLDFPPVQRAIERAMKTDLCLSQPKDAQNSNPLFESTVGVLSCSDLDIGQCAHLKSAIGCASWQAESAMRMYYTERGGDFVVALGNDFVGYDDLTCDQRTIVCSHDRVLGCVAYRLCDDPRQQQPPQQFPEGQDKDKRKIVAYEVFRLMVHPDYQGCCIATQMMRAVERAVRQKHYGHCFTHVRLVATTMNILTAANSFYHRHGFVIQKQQDIPIKGKGESGARGLVMNVFLKDSPL